MDIYVDIDGAFDGTNTPVLNGDGSKLSPYNITQLNSLSLNSDTVYIKGKMRSSSNYPLSINGAGPVTIKAWDLHEYGPFIIDMVDGFIEDKCAIDINMDSLTIKDMVLLSKSNNVYIAKINNASSELNIKNSYINSIGSLGAYGELSITNSPADSCTINMYGCTIVCGDFNVINSPTTGASVSIYDSLIVADSVYSSYLSGSDYVNIENSELNTSIGNWVTNTGSVVDNTTAESYVNKDVRLGTFDIDTLMSGYFNISSSGSGPSQWTTWDIELGISGNNRTGVGCLNFNTDTIKYYVNLDKSVEGTGLESDMFTYEQLKRYFDASLPVLPIERPNIIEFIIDGRINLYNADSFLNIEMPYLPSDTVILSPYKIEENSLYGFDIQKEIPDTYAIKTMSAHSGLIVMLNGILALSNGSTSNFHIVNGDSEIEMIVRGSVIHSGDSDLSISNTSTTELKMYGCSIVTNTLEASSGNIDLYDTVVKCKEVI